MNGELPGSSARAGSESGDDDRPTKRKRVTKACDQCSKRRRKCEGGQPVCASCTAAGRADQCTYSKPMKKRGPAAGYSALAKTASEKVRILELLLGDLMLLNPEVGDLAEVAVGKRAFSKLVSRTATAPRTDNDKYTAWTSSRAFAVVQETLSAFVPVEDEALEDLALAKLLRSMSALPPPTTSAVATPPAPSTSALYPIDLDPSLFNPSSSGIDFWNGTSGANTHSATSGPSNLPFPPFNVRHSAQQTSCRVVFGPSSSATLLSSSSVPLSDSCFTGAPPYISSPTDWCQLPSSGTIDILVDTYFNSTAHVSLPILDKQAVLTWARNRHSGLASSETNEIDLSLIFAIFATALPYRPDIKGKGRELSTESFAAQSEACILVAPGAPSLQTVQTLILLAFVELGRGDLFAANSHCGAAIGLALTMGMHQSDSTTTRESAGEYSLRTFWSLVILDTVLALRLGRCPLLRRGSYNVPCPSAVGPEETENWQQLSLPSLQNRFEVGFGSFSSPQPQGGGNNISPSHALSTFAHFAQLCTIGSDLLFKLNSPCVPEVVMESGGKELRAILVQLSTWESSLPAPLTTNAGRHAKVASLLRHQSELLILYHTFVLLCTRPSQSLPNSLSQDHPVSSRLRAALDHLSHHLQFTSFYLSRPYVESCLVTIASTLLLISSPDELETDVSEATEEAERWTMILESLRQLGKTCESCESTWKTIRAVKEGDHQPMSALLQVGDSIPTLRVEPVSLRSETNGLASDFVLEGSTMEGGDISVSMEDAGNWSGTDFALAEFEFGGWGDSDEVLQFLGVRGTNATQPPSPKAVSFGSPFAFEDEGAASKTGDLDVDLFGRWSSQSSGLGLGTDDWSIFGTSLNV